MMDLVPDLIGRQIAAGRKSSNLAAALRLLPQSRRADALTFYDFCRVVDDIADAPELPFEMRSGTLLAWKSALEGSPGAPALPAELVGVINRHEIDSQFLVAIVDGVLMDLNPLRFQTFSELRDYCWKVASAVGLASLRIFGVPSPHGIRYAEELGLALQLTNIIRDVGPDSVNGRIYFPLDELQAFGVSEEALLGRQSSVAFSELMDFQTRRAREHFAAASALRPSGFAKALRPADLMASVYETLLRKIERQRFPLGPTPVKLSKVEKLWLMFCNSVVRGA